MERSRRAIKHRAPASKFEELKAARSGGKSRLEQYNPDQDEHTLFDEIDEADYQRAKLQDDFVVDDHGEGYVDNGMEELERDRHYSSEEDEAEEDRRRGKRGKKKGRKENEEKVTEGAIDRLFRKPAIQMPKKVAVSTEEDADFMASILGELDESSISISRKRDRIALDDSRPAKKRHSSPTPPPLRTSFAANRQPRAQQAAKTEMPSSPPMAALTLNSDDGGFMDIEHDDSYYAPQQSSTPTTTTNGTNGIDLTHEESDNDDDIPVVKKLAAAKSTTQSTKSINISASKPALPPKVEVKKESSPIPEVPDATWRDLDSTLNVTAAPTSASSNKASPADVLETISVTVKEMVEQDDGTDLEIEKTVEKQAVNIFWLDYGEFNGVLGLFGKVLNKTTGQWISCFVKIEGIERCLYFLPRETNTGEKFAGLC